MKPILNKMTILVIAAIVIIQLALTGGASATTAWLFPAYGCFYIIRIIALMISDGSLAKFLNQ